MSSLGANPVWNATLCSSFSHQRESHNEFSLYKLLLSMNLKWFCINKLLVVHQDCFFSLDLYSSSVTFTGSSASIGPWGCCTIAIQGNKTCDRTQTLTVTSERGDAFLISISQNGIIQPTNLSIFMFSASKFIQMTILRTEISFLTLLTRNFV